MSRFASILTCLLALLVASPLCCCAAEKLAPQEDSCCCCAGGKEKDKKAPHAACLCAKDSPRELPDVAIPPHPENGIALACQPASVWLPVSPESGADLRPVWVPSVPWHAPPSQKRALLVSRTL